MEEKERYEYFFGTNTIKDNKTNQIYDYVVDLLNQQSMRIKELEEALKNEEQLHDLCIEDNQKDKDFLRKQIKYESDARNRFIRANQQLKQQLAESEKKNFELVAKLNLKEHKPAFCTLADRDCEALWQVEELQKQLSEKDKEYQSFKKIADENVNYLKNRILEETRNYNQDKILFAVEKLEKVKETTECVLDNALKNSSLNQSYYDRLLDEIDNQIKHLKEKE